MGAASNAPPVCRPRVACVFAASVGGHRWTAPPRLRQYWMDGFRAAGADQVLDAGLDSRPDAARPEVCDALRAAELIYFCGGMPGRIAETLAGTAAYDAIVDAANGGAVVVGGSAGAMVWGVGTVSVYYSDDEAEPVPLLGWLRDVLVFPHRRS